MNIRILIVEDDEPIKQFLEDFLKDEGFIVQAVVKGSQALDQIEQHKPDMVILDLNLPDIRGEDVLLKIRKDFPDLPVIILTAKSKISEIVKGLNLGADDYLPKPFSTEELLARINARLRHLQPNTNLLEAPNLSVNLNTRQTERDKKQIILTKTEFDLLVYLLQNKNKVLTREMMLNHIWGFAKEVETRVVDVYIGYLRKKLDRDFNPKLIVNVHGVGYMLKTIEN